MSGNVYEWCTDWFGAYPHEPALDPGGPAEGEYRVLRGGAWFSHGRGLRSAYRYRRAPDDRLDLIGLRLAGGFDPEAGQAGAGDMTADSWERSGQQGGGHGPGDGEETAL